MAFLDKSGLERLWGHIVNKLSGVENNLLTKINNKMNKVDPTGTGSFSLNRRANTTIGDYSFAEGYNTTASGALSHAEGASAKASGASSHAEGAFTEASGESSHAEGASAKASGASSHAEGTTTYASGESSHAEGHSTTASGERSHSEGYGTTAYSDFQHVQGKFNIADPDGVYADIIGNGSIPGSSETWVINDNAAGEFATTQISFTSNRQKFTSIGANYNGMYTVLHYDNNEVAGYDIAGGGGVYEFENEAYRTITFDTPPTGALLTWLQSNATKQTFGPSNAATVDWSGNAWYAGDVYVGSTSGTNRDGGSKKLATEEYVNSAVISKAVIDDGYIG